MNRIEINVITGEQITVELTEEEIAQAKVQYDKWLATRPTKEELIANLQSQINDLQGVA